MKRCSMLFALALMSAFTCNTTARAQETNDGLSRRSGSFFAEFSAANTGQGSGFLWGATAGAAMQGRVLGFVLRGTAEPSGQDVHLYQAVVGPRLAFELPWVKPYVEAGGGIGRNENSNGYSGSAWGAAWQAAAGVEHDLGPHLRWRILELAYGHIFAAGGVSPAILSTGVRVSY